MRTFALAVTLTALLAVVPEAAAKDSPYQEEGRSLRPEEGRLVA